MLTQAVQQEDRIMKENGTHGVGPDVLVRVKLEELSRQVEGDEAREADCDEAFECQTEDCMLLCSIYLTRVSVLFYLWI